LQSPFQTETQLGGEERERFIDDDDAGHIIAAIDMKDYGTVGCSYYSAEEEKLYMLGDSKSGEMETINACMLCVNFLKSLMRLADLVQ
jgi:DNA mismatch repair protein MSH5